MTFTDLTTLGFIQNLILQIIPGIISIVLFVVLLKWGLPKIASTFNKIGKMEKENNCNCSRCSNERRIPLWKWRLKKHFDRGEFDK